MAGITAAQSARNTLAAGVPVSYNSAQFLGHLPGRRGARGPVEAGRRPLLLVDEASTMPGPDLADLIAYAQARDGKLILAGDTSQLQAVENGGGMSLLADALGYARLAEPTRFRAAWEQQASLRLRDGDTTVLAGYDQHGRILGGDPEQMMDVATAAYVAFTSDGTDTLLMAAEHALRRELSRRIRDDLITLGVVQPGPAVRIADSATASPGDLITATCNDHTIEAGEPGRTLANGDLLRIEAVTAAGLVVRRALDADPATGCRRWTDRTFLYQHFGDAELGYAVTDHVGIGRTVHTGLAVITGTEDRQHAYVAMTRGTDANLGYVFTTSPKRADPVPGPRPAPELARYDHIQSERTGEPAPGTLPARPGEALGVLAAILDRDGQQHSATQTRRQSLADADHLALLVAGVLRGPGGFGGVGVAQVQQYPVGHAADIEPVDRAESGEGLVPGGPQVGGGRGRFGADGLGGVPVQRMIGHRAEGSHRPGQGVLGSVLADPVLAGVHQRGDLGDVRAAFGVGDGGDLRGPRPGRERDRGAEPGADPGVQDGGQVTGPGQVPLADRVGQDLREVQASQFGGDSWPPFPRSTATRRATRPDGCSGLCDW